MLTETAEPKVRQLSGLEYTEEERHLFGLITGFFKSKILATSIELDFFNFMSFRPRGFEEIQEQYNIPDRSLRVYLDSLIAMKLLSLNDAGKYQNTSITSRYLVKGKLSFLGDVVDLFDSLYDDFSGFKEMLLNNVPLKKSYSYFFDNSQQVETISDYSDQMYRTSGSPSMALSEFYDFSQSQVVIDIGGGTGKTCMNLVSQYPKLKCQLFDLPSVCEKAQTELSNFWLSHRIEICPGDFYKTDLPTGFDTALMMRITHDWSVDQIKFLFAKIYNALPVGGKLLVYETFKSDDCQQPGDAAMVSMLMLTISPDGECRTKGEIKSMLEEAGFSSIEFLHTVYIYSAIIAYK